MERAISSLLIMSGDDNPELVKQLLLKMDLMYRVQNISDFHPSVATEQELRRLENEYDIDLHKSWTTRLPSDLLVVCE